MQEFDVLRTSLSAQNPRVLENYQQMQDLCTELNARLHLSVQQGQQKYIERHHSRGKMLARDRIELLLDLDSPFLELMPLAGW